MRSRLLLAALLIAGSCAPIPRPAPSRAPVGQAPPLAPRPAPLAADWRDWPVTPGRWTYTRDERGSVALYGQTGTDAVALLRCDARAGRMFLSRAGTVAGPLTVRTSSIARTVQMGATGGEPPYVAASFAPTDSLLDAMAFSRGRFALDQPGTSPLALPAWAEIGRVIEDCRR